MKKIGWIASISGGTIAAVGAGAGIATGIILPKALKAKKTLSNFVILSGGGVNLSKTSKINYVALGDSITAGYNGYMKKDYVSYADFLAGDLKNNNKLNSYKNFAVSGAKITDLQTATTGNPGLMHSIKKADLITITVGSNDLLQYAKFLQFGFPSSAGFSAGGLSNIFRKAIDKMASKGVTFDETWKLVNHSITQLAEAYANDDFTGIVSLQKSLYKQAMDLIKRNLIITLRDLRKLAPHSKIVVLTPAFPFGNLRHDLTEGKMEELGNNNLHELFNVFKNSIKAAANQGSVADYYNIDDIADFKNNSEKITTGGIERLRKMPNAGDIHPSTYGHQLIGNGLFKLLKNQLGLTGPATHLVVGHAPNNDDKADLTLNNIYSPEYFDESTSPKLNRGLDELVRGIMTNPKKSFTNVLINSLDKILGLFNNGVSKTNNFYRVSSEEFTKEEIFTDPKPGFMDSLTGGQELFGFFKGLKGRQKKGVGTLNMMLSAGYSYASPADKLSMKTAMKKFHDDHLFTKVQLTTIQAVMKSIEGTIIKDTDTSIGTINAAALETTYGVKSVKEFLSKYKMSYMIKKYVNRAYIHIVFGNLSDTNPASTRAQDGPLQIMREFGFDEMIDVLDKTGMKYDKTKLTSTYNVGVAKFNTIFGEFNRKELINLNTKFINALNPFMKFLNEDPIDSFTNIIDPAKHQSGQLSQLFGKQFANINDPKVGKFVRADAKQISAQLQGDILAAYESFLTKHTDQEFTTIFKFLAKLSDSNGIVYVQNSFDLDKLKEIWLVGNAQFFNEPKPGEKSEMTKIYDALAEFDDELLIAQLGYN